MGLWGNWTLVCLGLLRSELVPNFQMGRSRREVGGDLCGAGEWRGGGRLVKVGVWGGCGGLMVGRICCWGCGQFQNGAVWWCLGLGEIQIRGYGWRMRWKELLCDWASGGREMSENGLGRGDFFILRIIQASCNCC